MRKGISSLCGVVHEKMGCEVRNGDVFIFIGSSRRLMKLLLTSSMRHPNYYSLSIRSKSGFTARCFSVRKRVLVK